MIDQSVRESARVTRETAEIFGELCGITAFCSRALIRLDRRTAAELCKEAVRQHPTDADARGYYIRRHAVRQTK